MVEVAVKEYLDYLNKEDNEKKELFEESKKISIQISLNKIPNLLNTKKVLW